MATPIEFQSDEGERVAARQAALDADPSPDKAQRAKDEEILREARERFALVASAEREQRTRELEDLKFDRAFREDQWDPAVLRVRMGSLDGGHVDNPRPCLVINKLAQPIQQAVNEAKNGRLSIRIKQKSGKATKKGATLRQGIIRAIEDDSKANIARFWALERAVKCGRGYYRVLKEYANDGDWDMDLRIKMIQNQASVYLDPYHKELDGSDAQWAFITDDISREEYRRRYKQSRVAREMDADASGEFLTGIGDESFPWVTDKNVRIAEYFYLTHTPRTRLAVPVPGKKGEYEVFWQDELGPDALDLVKGTPGLRKKTVQVPNVHWCVINGHEILDSEDWDGRYIPIIQVLGKTYNVNGERSYKGMIFDAKDAQRSYNVMRSAQVETVGLAPKAPWIIAEGQIEGYESEWAQANTRNYSVLTYRPTSLDGMLVGPPQRNVMEPALQGISLAVREAEQDIKDTTAHQDASLGKYRASESGRAIKERKEQAQTTSSNFIEFLANVSMAHEARILLDLAKYVYDRPGRVIRLLGEDAKKEEFALLGVPFVPGEDGMPVPVPPQAPPGPPMVPPMPGAPQMAPMAPGPPTPPGMPASPGMPAPPEPKLYTLDDDGDYAVSIAVGPSVETEKDDNARAVETIMEALGPQAAAAVADIYAEQITGPMGERLARRLAKLNPVAAQDEDDPDQQIPPVAAAKMFALQQQVQQLTQQAQQMQQALEHEQAAEQAKVAMSQMMVESRERIAMHADETKRLLAQNSTMSEVERAKFEAQQALTLQTLEFAHERMMAALKLQHADTTLQRQQTHDVTKTAMSAQAKETSDFRRK